GGKMGFLYWYQCKYHLWKNLAERLALSNSPPQVLGMPQLLKTAPVYAYRHRILQSTLLCVAAVFISKSVHCQIPPLQVNDSMNIRINIMTHQQFVRGHPFR
ncbi:hypothetical protein Tsp_14569, partial [Trichinella spiralis]|uniref:hypothetical protein n=1 Tax=Trichinella spiralis TaxID=6334 RepID=UPI0001EFEFD0